MSNNPNMYRTLALFDNLARIKSDTDDDPAWAVDQVHPGAAYITAGGVIDDGTYTITFDPVNDKLDDPTSIVFTRGAGETAAQVAEGLHDLITAALDPADVTYDPLLQLYIKRSEYRTGEANLYLLPVDHSKRIVITTTGTGGTGTLEMAPGSTSGGTTTETFPIHGYAARIRGEHVGPATALEIIVLSIDSSGNPAQDNNGCTFTLQLLRAVDRGAVSQNTSTDRRPGVASWVANLGIPLGRAVREPFNGGSFGVRLTSIAQTPTNHDHFEVRWREVVA